MPLAFSSPHITSDTASDSGSYPGGSPVQNALLPDIKKAHQDDADVHEHFPETEVFEISQDHRPRIQKHSLYIEQNEQHSYQVELHGETPASVPHWRHARFIWGHLGPRRFPFPDQPGKRD